MNEQEEEQKKLHKKNVRRLWQEKNKEKHKKQASIRYFKNKERHKENQKRYRLRNIEKVRISDKKSFLKKRHGLTLLEYQEMFLSQNARCAICGISCDDMNNSFHIDHCHKTGKNRGLLCGKCNRGLGFFQDSPEILSNAIQYLNKHSVALSDSEYVI